MSIHLPIISLFAAAPAALGGPRRRQVPRGPELPQHHLVRDIIP
jgi:hypothetical protein